MSALSNGVGDGSRPAVSHAVRSILDTDLYKLTMQQAVLKHYPDADVSYRFTNRSKAMKFTHECVRSIQASISSLSSLRLTAEERAWLTKRCSYLQPSYLDYLEQFRFKPEAEVVVQTKEAQDGLVDLELAVNGKWRDVILYEVPLMAIVSQCYFELVDKDWSLDGQEELAEQKAQRLVAAGIKFAEFGTRRRRSYDTHKTVIQGLLKGESEALAQHASSTSANESNGGSSSRLSKPAGKLLGTSNVHFAQLFDLPPSGTVAHEWTMAIAALEGYDGVNLTSLRKWDEVYAPPAFTPKSPAEDLTIALTDTFSTEVFWRDVFSATSGVGREGKGKGKEILSRWRGLRQDSGDSKAFARRAKENYEKLGVDPKSKVIIFSDGLDVDRCIDLAQYAEEIGIGAGFGVGTNLTNDFKKLSSIHKTGDGKREEAETSKALNIVIKMYSLNGQPTVKISDELTKNTGDAEEVQLVKRRFGLDSLEKDFVEDS